MTYIMFQTTWAAYWNWRERVERERQQMERYQLMHEAACRSERFGPGWCE